MATFNIFKKKLIYYDGPKCGSSTVLAYANLIISPELLEEVNKLIEQNVDPMDAYERCWRPKTELYCRKKIIERTLIEPSEIPSDAVRFCIVRDPIERFISVYKALILSGWFVKTENLSVDEFIKIIDADKKTLKNWTQVSPTGWSNVNFHFLPQVEFYGTDPKIFAHIFNMDQLDKVKELMETYSSIELPSLKLNATEKIEVELTNLQIEWIKKRYARDYKFYEKWMEKR